MNEGMYNGLSAEARETNSLLKQLLEEQKRTNELLDKVRQAANRENEQLSEAVSKSMASLLKGVASPDVVFRKSRNVAAETVETVDESVEPKATKKGK